MPLGLRLGGATGGVGPGWPGKTFGGKGGLEMSRDCRKKIILCRFILKKIFWTDLSHVILSLWMFVKHVITGGAKQLLIAFLTCNPGVIGTTQGAFEF